MNTTKFKNNFNKIVLIFIVILLLISAFSFVVRADGPFDSNSLNSVQYIDNQYISFETVEAIFNYYDMLYEYNMTNGRRLLGFYIYSNNSLYEIRLVFSAYNSDAVYATQSVTSGNRRFYFFDSEGNATSNYEVDTLLNYGNWTFTSQRTVNYYEIGTQGLYYAVRDFNGNIDTNFNYSHEVWPHIVDNYDATLDFIQNKFVDRVTVAYGLDIGSIITAMMNAGMSIFYGFTDFTIFGINISHTLISIAVLAIVVFIIWILWGGKK